MNLIYPGSFDPVTNGHLDIIERASRLADHLDVAVLVNRTKNPLFSLEERVNFLRQSTKHLENVEIITFGGLLVDIFKTRQIDAIVKGLRAVSDFEAEFQMAQINRELYARAETLFMMTSPQYAYLSSSLLREIHSFGGNIGDFAPSVVVEAMDKKREEK